jgi:hypothetical protein
MDWPTVTAELGKILGPAIITGLSSYLIARNQFKTKELELTGQSEIKGKELLFNAYQKRIERISNVDKDFGDLISRITPLLEKSQGKLEIQQIGLVLRAIAKSAQPIPQEDVQELEQEIAEAGLAEKRKVQVDFIRAFSRIDWDQVTPEQMLPLSFEMVKYVMLTSGLRGDLLTKKGEDLFGTYAVTPKRKP